MSASTTHLIIEQGADLSQAITGLTSYNGQTARAMIRSSFGGALLAELTCSAIADGSCTVSLTAAQTALLVAGPDAGINQRDVAIGWWDLEAVNGDTVTRLAQGRVILSREVTTS